jgi:hypothetical protein
MDFAFGSHTIRITVTGGTEGRAYHPHWAVYDPRSDDPSPLFEDWSEQQASFAEAQRAAKADAINWLAAHGDSVSATSNHE